MRWFVDFTNTNARKSYFVPYVQRIFSTNFLGIIKDVFGKWDGLFALFGTFSWLPCSPKSFFIFYCWLMSADLNWAKWGLTLFLIWFSNSWDRGVMCFFFGIFWATSCCKLCYTDFLFLRVWQDSSQSVACEVSLLKNLINIKYILNGSKWMVTFLIEPY